SRCRQGFSIEGLIHIGAYEVDEEAEPEDAVDDRRHARKIVHGDAYRAGNETLAGIFAQIDRGNHSEWRYENRHQQHHDHCAKNGREYTAFGIGFPGLIGQELHQLLSIHSQLSKYVHAVRLIGAHDVHHADLDLAAVHGTHQHGIALSLVIQLL